MLTNLSFKKCQFYLKEDNFIKKQKQCLTNTFGFLKFMQTQVEWNQMINQFAVGNRMKKKQRAHFAIINIFGDRLI